MADSTTNSFIPHDGNSSLSLNLSFQGKTVPLTSTTTLEAITPQITGAELHQVAYQALGLSEETRLKLVYKGKQIHPATTERPLEKHSTTKKIPTIMVLATSTVVLSDLATKRSDPTIRGFDQEKPQLPQKVPFQYWGSWTGQDKNFKFCKFEACTWQSFGHRPTDSTPHAFQAMELLERLATDPGIVAVMKERELVVGTLGEMDPIDDRIMQKVQHQGGGSRSGGHGGGVCLLGYNTNAGLRIDIKLRTEDLSTFRPYPQLVQTLLHELSHNWVGEHNLLFWTNYGQMRAEYLWRHWALQSTLVHGKTTATLAQLNLSSLSTHSNDDAYDMGSMILQELVPDMAQHGLHPRMIERPIRQRCQELREQYQKGHSLQTQDTNHHPHGTRSETTSPLSLRERALAAAEERRRRQQEPDVDRSSSSPKEDARPS